MATNPTTKRSWLAGSLARRSFFVFAIYAAGGALALTTLSWQHSKDIRETTALKAAEAYSQSVSAMRAFYSKHVVPRASNAGATMSHDYLNSDTAIPFPATLTIELANELRQQGSAFSFNFYSAEPFPWRQGREIDAFEKDALAILGSGAKKRFLRYENYQGQRSVRIAYPVIMGQNCVSCHNSHPLSPRTDWKIGDIRGVQQITLPIGDVGMSFIPDIRKSAAYLGIFVLAGLGLIWVLLRELKSRIEQAEDFATTTEEKNKELIAAKAEADQANRAQGDLIANVGHELRTPLNSIIGFSEILKEERMGSIGNEEYKGFANDIFDGGRQLLDVINSILYMAQLEAGKTEMQQEFLPLDRVINECKSALTAASPNERLPIDVDIAPGLPQILFDRRGLAKIFEVVVGNALKFNKPEGRVTVSGGLSETNDIVLKVEDTGVGISPQMLREILKPFRQADGSRARRFEGVGLGLAMANAIAKVHGARIDIESTENVGTTVTLTIPQNRVVFEKTAADSDKPIAA